MKKLLGAMLIGTIIFSACKKDHDDNNNNNTNATDQDFAAKAWMANNFEIDAAQTAIARSAAPAITGFAQSMVTEHGDAKTSLQAITNDLGIALPDTLDNQDAGIRSQLIDIGPALFDSLYIHSQVEAHQKAITIFQAEINGGMNERLKTYATEQLPHLQTHLQNAQAIAVNY